MLHFIAPLENIDVQRTVFKDYFKKSPFTRIKIVGIFAPKIRLQFWSFWAQKLLLLFFFFADLIFKHCGYAQ